MSDGVGIALLAAAIVLLIGGAGYAIYQDEKDWVKFANAHSCVKVGETSSSVATGWGVTTNGSMGMVTTYQAGKIGYKCDDGVTYWK